MSDRPDDSGPDSGPEPERPSLAEDLAGLWRAVSAMAGDLQTTCDTIAPGCSTLSGCPLCRIATVFQRIAPEVSDDLVAAAGHLTNAAGSFLAAASAAASSGKPGERRPASDGGFERISLGDDEPDADPAEIR
ncbi:MAG: hypothetical protein ACRCYQ_15915 [Nocardioides sp.]